MLFILVSCTKQYFYSGLSEKNYQLLLDSYNSESLISKSDIINTIGNPLIQENEGNLWIYRSSKDKGNETFRANIYNITIKFFFEENILIDIIEIPS